MKRSLFVLSVGLLLSTSALAGNWNYAQNPSASAYGTYQKPVACPEEAQQEATSPVRKKHAYRHKSEYRMGNPLYHPRRGQTVLTGGASYYYTPREEKIGQDKTTGWTVDPAVELGLTNKLSLYANGEYGRFRTRTNYGPEKFSQYDAAVGVRYLLASADGFDFNASAGLYYSKERVREYGTLARRTGSDVGIQVGKKIQNVTPYFGVGFKTDFWSKRHSSNGTDTYINPGVYIDLTKALSLNLNYTSVVHGDAMYRAIFDVYASNNVMFSFGGFIIHPETDKDTYGATAAVKVAF